MNIDKKVANSVRLLQSYAKRHKLILAYSGGKDSDVCRRLCQIADIEVELVYNNTTIDPPGTISRNLRLGARIQRPEYSFYELVAKKGLPSMFRRFCCEKLKEQFIAPYLIIGVRASESVRRAARYTEPTACRVYSKKLVTETIMPLYNWTQEDLAQFIEQERLSLHPHYYDENGELHLERRLGCIGCPLQGDRGKADYLRYPKHFRLLCSSYAKYVESHKAVVDVYADILYHLFYSNHGTEKFNQAFNGLFAPPDAKKILEDYFHIDLP